MILIRICFHLLITDGTGVCSAETDMVEGSSENIIMIIQSIVIMVDEGSGHGGGHDYLGHSGQ